MLRLVIYTYYNLPSISIILGGKMGMKMECMECGEKFEIEDWEEIDECPECGSADLDLDYGSGDNLPAEYFVYLAGL